MIRAVKSKAFERIFTLYNHYYLLRRRFRSFTLSGSLDPQVLDGNGRLQPMAPDQCGSLFHEPQLMVGRIAAVSCGEENLAWGSLCDDGRAAASAICFFRKLGAYSINKDSSSGVRTSLQYTNELLAAGKGSGSSRKVKFCIRRLGRFSFARVLDLCCAVSRRLLPCRSRYVMAWFSMICRKSPCRRVRLSWEIGERGRVKRLQSGWGEYWNNSWMSTGLL